MSIDLTSASNRTSQDNFNPINLSVEKETIVLPEFIIAGGFHAGSIDYSISGLDGYHGVGLNQFGLYGIDAGTPKFLCASKSFDHPDTWGAVAAGTVRVGEDVSASGILDTTKTSFIFDSAEGTMVLNNASLIFRDSTHFVALNATGIVGGLSTGAYTFFLSNAISTTWTDDVIKGEFRIGEDVDDLTTTSFRFLPGTGLSLEDDLVISSGSAVITGNPAGDWSALNSTGFAGGTGGEYTLLMSNTVMAVTTPTVAGEVRFGDNVGDISNSDDYFWYLPGTGLEIKIAGETVLSTGDFNSPEIANNYTEDGVTTISRPIGGTSRVSGAGETGVIKIQLPQSWTASMIKFDIDVFDYAYDKCHG